MEIFREKLQNLISKFEKDKNHYLSKGYPEAQVRIDFKGIGRRAWNAAQETTPPSPFVQQRQMRE
jgi:hypothetical protein